MAKRTTRPHAVVSASTGVPNAPKPSIIENEIARHAYDLYLSRGCQHGHDIDDWLQAERELIRSATSVSDEGRRHEADR